MRSTQLCQFQSLRRVRQFLDAHADVLGAVNGSDLRRELDATVTQLESTVTEQGARTRGMRGERNNQRALEGALARAHLSPIAKFARAELTGVPNFAALTPAIRKLEGDRLVHAAREMAREAAVHADIFVAGHFAVDFAAQLTSAADAVEASIRARSAQQMQRVNATQAVDSSITAGRAIVTRLDARITRLIAGDAALLAEWRVAKRITVKPGIPRGSQVQVALAVPKEATKAA